MNPEAMLIPGAQWRALRAPLVRRRAPRGLDALWERGAGVVQRLAPRLGQIRREARRVANHAPALAALSDRALDDELKRVRERVRLGREHAAESELATALVAEAAARTLGLRPVPEQIMGARAIGRGWAIEMATGEGKTLTAALAAALCAWRGRGCHVVTANEYLATRDALALEPLFERLGVRVAALAAGDREPERRNAYLADVTYATSKELAADWLRDRLLLQERGVREGLAAAVAMGSGSAERGLDAGPGEAGLLQRGLEWAIIDEGDSVLIDEAVTPLILSGQGDNAELASSVVRAAELVQGLQAGRDYIVDESRRDVQLTDLGAIELERCARGLAGVWAGQRRREELAVQALSARELFQRGREYIVQSGAVVIVDEFTGRLMPDRSWRDGMHQAVEAKEGLTPTPVKTTLASVSFQRFFAMYRSLGAMSGTLRSVRGELWRTYRLPLVPIPTHRPLRRVRLADRAFARLVPRLGAVVEVVADAHRAGRPVLVGTRSVESASEVSAALEQAGIAHACLTAETAQGEAELVARAGECGRVTVATNVAGRGTDIRLGAGVVELGGLLVVGVERNQSVRVDDQLAGRAGRQGDPGASIVLVSMEDELVVRWAPWAARGAALLSGRTGGVPGWAAGLVVRLAQARAQRAARASRRSVRRADDWLDDALGFAR